MVEINDFYFAPFCEEKIDDLIYLFEIEGKHISRKYILNKYKYVENKSNKNFLGFMAYDKFNIPAAFVGGFYMKLNFKNTDLDAIQIGDVITNQKYRGKGLFIKTSTAFFQYLKSNTNFYILFAFPNENSSPGFFNKLGWHKNDSLQLFEYHNKMFNFYGLFHKFSFLSTFYSWYKSLVVNLIFKTRTLPNSYSALNSNYKVSKDSDFFTYKRRYSDSSLIRMFGNYYLIKFIDGIQIDFLSSPSEKQLKRDLTLISILFGVKKIITICTSNNAYMNHFLNAGFNRNEKIEWNNGYYFLNEPEKIASFCFSISDTDEF